MYLDSVKFDQKYNFTQFYKHVFNLINEAFPDSWPVKIAPCGLASLWFRSDPSPSNIVYGYARTG